MSCDLCHGERFIGNHHPCPACTASSMHVFENYREEIDRFFREEDPIYSDDYSKGHTWMCDHGPFQTLTVEPLTGGQYEVAVRFPCVDKEVLATAELMADTQIANHYDRFSGYVARDGYMIGRNTHGH